MRKVVSKEVTAGGRFDFFLDSVVDYHAVSFFKKGNCLVVDNLQIQRIVVDNSPHRRCFLLIDNI